MMTEWVLHFCSCNHIWLNLIFVFGDFSLKIQGSSKEDPIPVFIYAGIIKLAVTMLLWNTFPCPNLSQPSFVNESIGRCLPDRLWNILMLSGYLQIVSTYSSNMFSEHNSLILYVFILVWLQNNWLSMGRRAVTSEFQICNAENWRLPFNGPC